MQPGDMPGPGAQTAPAAVQPQSIQRAVLLMRVGAGLSLLSILITVLTRDSLRSQVTRALRRSSTTLTAQQVDTAVTVAVSIAVVVGLISVGLWLWMASANAKGRGWARIVATVLGVLSVLSLLSSVAQGQMTTLNLIVSLVSLVLAIVILVLLWRKESSAYYEAVKAQRH
jgi:multisubunit Na+/H+ antiporter MnhB subunit